MLIRLENGCGNSHNFHFDRAGSEQRNLLWGGGGIPKLEYFSDIVKGTFRLAEFVLVTINFFQGKCA